MITIRTNEPLPEPSYLALWKKGLLQKKARELERVLLKCELCPRRCQVNRLGGETGTCSAGRFPVISSYGPHYGEEPPLVGSHGSGTIFLTHCNLLCEFCQNYDISHLQSGTKVSITQLAGVMNEIQEMGCHNLNLVTPTHFVPQIVAALNIAVNQGFRLPLVYNCGGYESLDIIRELEGIVDIYMPDLKFLDKERSKKLLKAEDYPEVVQAILKEMHRQVGVLTMESRGIAVRGVLVRYLVMPETADDEYDRVFSFLAGELSADTYVNIMQQYRPLYKARNHPDIDRPIRRDEFDRALDRARAIGLRRGF